MAELLLIGAVAVLTFLVVLVALLLWRPPKGDDGDRFKNARRITSAWAADADVDHARIGAPVTPAGDPPEVGGESWVRVVEEIPPVPQQATPEAVLPQRAVPEAVVLPRSAGPAAAAPEPAVPESVVVEPPVAPEGGVTGEGTRPPTPPAPRRAGTRRTRA